MHFSTCVRDRNLCQRNIHNKTKTRTPQTGQPQQTNKQQTCLPTRLVPAGALDHHPPTTRKDVLYIATLNTRTLRTQESLLELEQSLGNIKCDILGISEMRRLGEKIEERAGYILYQKGEIAGHRGVGFLIKQPLKKYIQELIGISDRLAILNIKLPGYKKPWAIIQAYAPTEQADLPVLEAFYEELSLAIKSNADNHIILMGDFNAQIGTRQNIHEYVLGKFGYGKRSRNGQKLVEFLMEHNLSALNSFFKKNQRNKWTWISPDGSTKNEIDYIMSNFPKTITDTTVISNLNFNTNHRMVRCSLRVSQPKMSRYHIKTNINHQPRQPCPNKSNNIILKEVENQINNAQLNTTQKYEILEKELQYLNTRSSNNMKGNKPQFSEHTRQQINERKKLMTNQSRKENRNLISDLSKKIRESIRKDRKVKRLKTLEYHIQKTGGVKKALKELRESGKEWIPKLKKRSKTTAIRQNINDLATNFYRQLYSKQDTETTRHYNEIAKEQTNRATYEPVAAILQCEVEKAIRSQKTEKSPGPDKITNELMRGTLEELTQILTTIFNEILLSGHIPEQWTKSHIILIHKKGDKENIENYRPISLMSNVYKVFAKIILERISALLDDQQPVEQAGFRKGFSTIDHIHTIKQVLEKCNEYNKKIYLAFIDYAKAFDSLNHKYIWESLEQQGIPNQYTNIIKTIYSNSKAKIQLETLGEEFIIQRGVRQGDPLSPKLFSAVLENIFRKLTWDKYGININGSKLHHLRFADDLILLDEHPKNLESMINSLNEESIKVGLKMNTSKTKVMTNTAKVTITVNNSALEYVEDYIYLGQVISTKDQMTKEINLRIASGWKKYWALKEIMKSKELGISMKRKTFNSCILPCLTYGCETWTLTKALREKLAVAQRAMERSLTGYKRQDKIRNNDLRSITKLTDVLTRVDQQKWRWTGHMMRDKLGKWSRKVTEWYPRDGKRNRGRQNSRWEDELKRTAGPYWRRVTQDRQQWKLLEEAFANRHAEVRDIL